MILKKCFSDDKSIGIDRDCVFPFIAREKHSKNISTTTDARALNGFFFFTTAAIVTYKNKKKTQKKMYRNYK